jgi:hypothetical protein
VGVSVRHVKSAIMTSLLWLSGPVEAANTTEECGQITSIASPGPLHDTLELFDFTYEKTQHNYGVKRSNPNSLGMLAVVSTAYASKKNLTTIHRVGDPEALTVQIQPGGCSR